MKFISWNVNGLRACMTKGFQEYFDAMTCMELCNATQVTILSGVRTVTMGADDLLLYDDTIPEETLLEEAQ